MSRADARNIGPVQSHKRTVGRQPIPTGEPNSCVRTCQVVEKIAAIPATRLTGLRVNAKAVTWMETDDYKPPAIHNFEWSLRQEVVAGVLALVNVD